MSSTIAANDPRLSFEFHAPGEDVLNSPGLVVPHLYDWNAKTNPNYPLFLFHDGEKRQYITYSLANEAISRAARYTLSSVGPHDDAPQKPRQVIAMLANTDTITYFCTIVGALRAGFTVFLVSTRNAPVAVVDMLQRTGTTHLFVSGDASMQNLAKEALASLSDTPIAQHAMPTFEDLFPAVVDPSSPFESEVVMPTEYDVSGPALIMHSSGSMGHPKPITWTHSRLSLWGKVISRRGDGVRRLIMGCHGTPMFHAMGGFLYTTAPVGGFVIAAFKPASPPTIPTPQAVWDGVVATGANVSFCVPSFIEQWSRDPEKVTIMKKMRGLVFGGAALNDEVGNALAAQGVTLWTVYGATETGLVNTFLRENPGKDWQYWSVSPGVKCVFRPMDDGNYEIVVVSSPDVPLPKVNTTEGDSPAYATSDLAVPHPSIEGLWRIVGRADEQIILSNGEKTNPLPLEKMINDDPHIERSVMFGRGRFQNGVLIEPTKEFAIDSTDIKELVAFRNLIWPMIEEVNAFAPQHSRIFKEMILVTGSSKPIQLNAKGVVRRGVVIGDYHDEIEALYKEVESSAQTDIPPPASWDADNTLSYVRAVVQRTLDRAIADNADIFRSGGDSLQATWIRNTILGAVRATHRAAAPRIPTDLVFAAPSIAALARVVHGAVHGSDSGARTPADLWEHVSRHGAGLPARPVGLAPRAEGARDVVLITGTTGGFGCDALEHLLRDETVARVYAFNRKGTEAMERQRKQFSTRGLDEALLDSEKFVMVEAALHEPEFGIAPELLEEIRGSVSHILLNAWTVNFNMSIASFEADLQGTRNFVDLALSSPYTDPPAIVFVSSISVFSNCKLAAPVPEVSIIDPESPFGSGYPESKWVAERLLEDVARRAGVRTVVVRLGQVVGDRLGYWNEKEWFPSLVKTALHQRCLPELEGDVTWFPAYESAKAFTEMRHSREPFLHLVHPRPVPWHSLVAPVAERLGVPLVGYDEWLAKLAGSVAAGSAEEVEAMAANPALRLLPFFQVQNRTAADREPMGLVILSTEKATEVSGTLAALPELDAARAVSWVEAWKKSGFL